MWDNVPWFIPGGAKHTANVARLLAYAAFGGREGVITADALEVRETVPAGTGVRVMPGACAILNRGQGITYDAYAGRHPVQETVPIAATTSQGERTDLIIARVENPFQAGEPWTDPTPQAIEAGTATFIRTAVIAGVDKTKTAREILDPLGYSAIPLARITVPLSTATITQSMITDLRTMLSERKADPIVHVASSTTASPRLLTNADYVTWPNEMSTTVAVPSWATHVTMLANLGGVRYGASGTNGGLGWSAKGQLRMSLGSLAGIPVTYDESNEGGVDRRSLLVANPRTAVPRSMRGTNQTARIQGLKSAGTSELRADGGTVGVMQIIFSEGAESGS